MTKRGRPEQKGQAFCSRWKYPLNLVKVNNAKEIVAKKLVGLKAAN